MHWRDSGWDHLAIVLSGETEENVLPVAASEATSGSIKFSGQTEAHGALPPLFFFCNTLPQVVNRDRSGMEGNGEQTRKPPAGELPSKKNTHKNTSAPSGSPAQRSALPAQAVRGLRSESEAFLVAKQVRKEQNMGALVVETVNRFPATRGWRISVRPSLNIFIGLPCRPKTENNEAARKVGEYSRRGSGRCCPQGTRVAQSRTNPKEENNKRHYCSPYRGSVTLGGDPPIPLSGVGARG
jgi:hypothetical protein